MQEINVKNYLVKKKIQKKNMEEIDIVILSEKNKERLREYQKVYHETKK